jgi:hypothetical protein
VLALGDAELLVEKGEYGKVEAKIEEIEDLLQ